MDIQIPIEVSARHIHLSKEDLEKLFGEGFKLTKLKDLYQPSDFAANETLGLSSGDKKIANVRIVGPLRKKTQVEISLTDALSLGINPPIRLSGNLDDSLSITLIGPKGELKIEKGVIVPLRHVHCSAKEARKMKLKKDSLVSVRIDGERPIVFNKVKVRINEDYRLAMHIDTDEGNAAGIDKKIEGKITSIK